MFLHATLWLGVISVLTLLGSAAGQNKEEIAKLREAVRTLENAASEQGRQEETTAAVPERLADLDLMMSSRPGPDLPVLVILEQLFEVGCRSGAEVRRLISDASAEHIMRMSCQESPVVQVAFITLFYTAELESDVGRLVDQLESDDFTGWRAAIRMLSDIGEAAAPSIPVLEKHARRRTPPPFSPEVPDLESFLTNYECGFEQAGELILALAPRERAALPAWAVRLTTGDPVIRLEAVKIIGQLGSDGWEACPLLIEALDDPDESVRCEVITALGMIGPAAKDAIPTLEKLIESDDAQSAELAKAALRQIRG